MSPKLFSLIQREYMHVVRRKAFVIGTFLTPVFFAVVMLLPAYLAERDTTQLTIAVQDASGQLTDQLSEALSENKLENGKSKYVVEKVDNTEEALEEAKKRVEEKKVRGLMVIPKDVVAGNKIDLFMRSVTEFRVREELRNAATSLLRQMRLDEKGIPPSVIGEVMRRVDLNVSSVVDEEQKDETSVVIVSAVFVFLLYMTLIMYGTSIMMAVIEDKTTRVYEVMLSCVTARQILFGKVLGVGFASLTQYAVWATAFFVIKSVRPIEKLEGITIEPTVIGMLLLLFLLGYLVYALLYAALGSICSSTQEAQQVQWPLLMFLIVPMAMMMPLMMNPDGTLALVLSLFPMTAPVAMPLRLGVTSPSPVELGICVALLVGMAYVAYIVSGRIFRIAILVHGKRPKWKQVIGWLTTSET
ncbi:ABC transporter permease [bacterium]|nr:ABC transporter permease [bacterium]